MDAALWYRAAYDAPLLMAVVTDLDGRVLDVNRRAVEGTGLARADVVGRLLWRGPWWGTDEPVRQRIRALCLQAAQRGEPVRAESPWWLADGSEHLVDLSIHQVPDASGRPAHLFLNGLDITERAQAERSTVAGAERAARMLQETADERAESIRVLQAARTELAGSLQLTQHVLDNIADGIYGLDSELRADFVNPSALATLGHRLEELLGQDMHALVHRLPDGSPCRREDCFAVRALGSSGVVRSDREVFARGDGTLVPVEVVAVPTVVEGAVTGVVVSFRDLTQRLAAEEQAEQLRALAQREALQAVLSDGLQKALLTAPPSPPGLAIAVRYRPAAAEAQVGGDWYDTFDQPDGTTIVVIGDVVGHDSSAASAMAQLRGVLRGTAYASQDPPSSLLTRFDVAAQGLGIQALATAVLARIQPADPGSGTRRVTWGNAGHLPPVLVRPDGTPQLLSTAPELLLGLRVDVARSDHAEVLAPGATLLLYTDGLVERRGVHLGHGLEWLRARVGELAGLDVDDLCDALLADVGHVEDDIALLALRIR